MAQHKEPEISQKNDPATKEAILQAACELFGDRGFAATGIRAIAERAGCNLSMISYYFKSKDGLFQEIITRFAGISGTTMRDLTAKQGSAEEKVAHLVDYLFSHTAENRSLFVMMLRDITLSPNHPLQPVMRGIFESNFSSGLELLHSLQRQRKADAKGVDIEPEVLMMFMMGTIMSAVMIQPLFLALDKETEDAMQAKVKQSMVKLLMAATVGLPNEGSV